MSALIRPESGHTKKIDVDEADRKAVHGPGKQEPAVRSSGKNVFFIGPDGSGRKAVGQGVAKRRDMDFVEVNDLNALQAVLAGDTTVVAAVDRSLVDDGEGAALLKKGVVFYLMAGAQAVAEARGLGNGEQVKRDVYNEIQEWEERFMRSLHFIIPGGQSLEAQISDAAGKLNLVR